ncbi:unnamed protein product, partial [Rotaria sp. Silwood2]
MPTGQHYSPETKELMFNVIKFIEREKNGATIPLYNANDRIMAALQISHGSLVNLKNELKQLEEEQQKVLEQQLLKEQQQQRPFVLAQKYKNERLRRRSSSPYTIPTIDQSRSTNTPRPAAKSPAKRGGPTNLKISLTEYYFHLLLAEKIYPNTSKLLTRILIDNPNFPVKSITSLWRVMKKIGFSYRRTSTICVPMDSTDFIAQRASYFRKLDEIRLSGTLIFYHDETWINSGEEKRAVWVDEHGQGRIRTTQEKGNARSITIIIDNASWHREVTDDTKPPQRSWRKQMTANWLDDHNILYVDDISKAELLQLAYENLPKKKYKVDEEAKMYRINILHTTGYHSSKRIDSSGRSIEGRGFMWYTEKSRSRSHTPPHWRSAVEDRKSRHTDKEKHNNTREDLHLGRHERQRHDDHQTESRLRHKYQSRSRSPDNHRSIITKHKENNVSNISQKSHPSSSSPP